MNKKVGLFGGSFNPPHVCHSMVCLYVLQTTEIDTILLVPCYTHALEKKLAPFPHRYEMCRLLAQSLGDCVKVSDIEAHRDGISYTIDTILEFKTRYPENEFTLLIGSDAWTEKDKWKDFDRIREEVEILTLPRYTKSEETSFSSGYFFFPDVSSTMIREKIQRGEPIDAYVPLAVRKYIRKHNLYR